MERKACKRGGGRGRHVREVDGEEGMQERRRERKACKRGGGRGRHVRE